MIRPVSRLVGLGVGVVALVAGSGSVVLAQGNTFNPYGNSGYADYREFARPTYSNDPSLPGQARLQSGLSGRNRANQFESYLNSLDNNADPFSQSRGMPSGVPYYQAQRYLNRDRQVYRPNDSEAERAYQAGVRQRNQAYFKAMNETDPRKRALMLQQIERRDVAGRAAAAQATRRPRATGIPARPAAGTGPAATRPAPTATVPTPITNPVEPAVVAPAGVEPAVIATPAEAPAPIDPSTVPIPAPR